MQTLRQIFYPRGILKWDGTNLDYLLNKKEIVMIENERVQISRSYGILHEKKETFTKIKVFTSFNINEGGNIIVKREKHLIAAISEGKKVRCFLNVPYIHIDKKKPYPCGLTLKKNGVFFSNSLFNGQSNNFEFQLKDANILANDFFTFEWYCYGFSTPPLPGFSFFGESILSSKYEDPFILPSGAKCYMYKTGTTFMFSVRLFLTPPVQREMKIIFARVFDVEIENDINFVTTFVPLEVVNKYINVMNRILMEFQPKKYSPDAQLVKFYELKPVPKSNMSYVWATNNLYNIQVQKLFVPSLVNESVVFKLDVSSSLKEMAYKTIQDRIVFLLAVPYFNLSLEEKAELNKLFKQITSLNPGVNMDCEICQIKFATHQDKMFRPVCKDCGEQELN